MNRIRLSILAVLIAAVVVVVVATSGGAAKTGRPAVASTSAISVRQTSLGKIIVDANGRTLYLFAGDKRNLSTLSAAGQAVWPLYSSTATPASSGGAVASRIATTTGTGGMSQITYNGHPLYYYVGDHKPGDTNGQGLNQFGARWYVLGPGGTAITSASTAPAPAAPSSGGYGY
jgi:predicted lipoprotein with Yx(FWY)xxD motif